MLNKLFMGDIKYVTKWWFFSSHLIWLFSGVNMTRRSNQSVLFFVFYLIFPFPILHSVSQFTTLSSFRSYPFPNVNGNIRNYSQTVELIPLTLELSSIHYNLFLNIFLSDSPTLNLLWVFSLISSVYRIHDLS